MTGPAASGGIPWRGWGRDAFDRARAEDRLVLLYLSASWCHWCHVMEDESLSHPEVQRQLSARYIPVRVDSDRRPDINSRYNMGGWPSVVILSPDGEVLAGETYLPPGSLLQMLHQVHDGFYGRGEPAGSAPSAKAPRPAGGSAPEETAVDPGTVDRIAERLKRAFDPEYGGFAGPVKFPPVHPLELVFDRYRRTSESGWLEIAVRTLDAMRDGGLHDPVDGGFFRYAAARDWERPHTEKMLETQAGLLVSYLSGFRITGDERYRVTAREIVDYAMTVLYREDEGGFGGSQAADPDYYGADEDERDSLAPPPVDATLYTGWNAQTASALLKAAVVLGDDGCRQTALGVLDGLTGRLVGGNGQAQHYYSDGKPCGFGMLADQSELILASLDAYEWTGEARYLEGARGLLDAAMDLYWDGGAGCFRDGVPQTGEPGLLSEPMYPLLENARMVRAMLRAAVLIGESDYRARSESVLRYFSGRVDAFRLQAAPYAVAADRFLHEPAVVTILAPFGDPRRRGFIESAARLEVPGLILEHLDAEVDAHRIEARGFDFDGEPAAYVCVGKTCWPPVRRPSDLAGVGLLTRGEGSRNV